MGDKVLFLAPVERLPDPDIAREVFRRAQSHDGKPLSTRQRLVGMNALLRVIHVAEAEPSDPLVNGIIYAVREHRALAPELIQTLYDAQHPGAYETLATFVAWDLEEDLRWPTILAATLIVRPEDVASLSVGDA